MEDLVASLTGRIEKYSENLKQLAEDIEALRVKGKLVRDIDDIVRRISKLSMHTSKHARSDDSSLAYKRRCVSGWLAYECEL